MAFATQELSTEGGQPIELYQLTLKNTTWYMTTSDVSVVANGITYVPTEISRKELAISPAENTDVLEVTIPGAHAYSSRYVNIVPGQNGVLTISRMHFTDTAQQLIVLYKGVVKSVAFTNNGTTSTLAVVPMTSVTSRQVPRYTYQGLCNNVLYDSQCTVPEAAFRVNGLCTALTTANSQLTITGLSAKGDGWATGGYVTYNGEDFRLVISHTGNNITVFIPFPPELPILNSTLDVFAGCDHSPTTCNGKFANLINFSGFAWVPTLNPFSTSIA